MKDINLKKLSTIKDKVLKELLDHPLIASIFIIDFAILLFHRPPAFFSIIMLGALTGISMFFGQKLSLFKHESS